MITIPVSVGELVDKYTILQIKRQKVSPDKLSKVQHEIESLTSLVGPFIMIDSISNLYEDLIGVTKSYTEDAVLVKVNDKNEVVAFSRDKISDLEWTGIAYFSNITISKEGKYVYQEIEKYLPVKAIEIECFEIDTPRDLEILSNKTML